MEEAIKNFAKQFEYEPVIENPNKLGKFKKYIVAGMGGSHLAAGLIKLIKPKKEIIVHSDYGLPKLADESLKEYLFVASSYSGNTEEVLDALEQAHEQNLESAITSTGGKLIELAKKNSLSYIKMPQTGIQPRSALGFSFRALLKLMGEEGILRESSKLSSSLKPLEFEEQGSELAKKLKGYIPVIYSSTKNKALAYNWKIKFNETGKIPAFYNVFPELNHNEMTGYSAQGAVSADGWRPAAGGDVSEAASLSSKFYFIFLKDTEDDSRVTKRMDVLQGLYSDRGINVEVVTLSGSSALEKIFSSLLIADWTALHTAKNYDLEPERVPMVEEFKKMI